LGKNDKNVFPGEMPPSLGPWRFVMSSGMAIPGEVSAVYDDFILVETPDGETVLLNKQHIESYWEGKGKQDGDKEGDGTA
jgi:hypothetical protein